MEGSAPFTIVTSSTIISCARQTTPSVAQRRRSDVALGRRVEVDTAFIRLPTCRNVLYGLKWRPPPELYGGSLRFVNPNFMSTTEAGAQTLITRPKRADARRNYEKVLAAAREAFAEGGESTALEEIARRAGVGIGTLYRHFPNRQALL